ncbi:hypothetical protein GCM10009751_16060 [Myceligenerans crystallogenes]|uniref:RAMA domain-containing protein n=1 Tax=Myceligenerans crystallogenes TaxID=316335 RepID=A0ABP4ZIW0_9MICO
MESHIDGLLGEQVFPVSQGTGPDEPHLLALDASGLPVVVELVGDLDKSTLTRALDHAGAAGRLTRGELAARYHGGQQRFAHDVAEFYDSVPITQSSSSKSGGGARLIIICQNAPQEILNAVDFLRQPTMPVEVLKMDVVKSDDGRRFLDVSPLVIHLPPGLPSPRQEDRRSITRGNEPARVTPEPVASAPMFTSAQSKNQEDVFAEGVKVGYALTGKLPVVAHKPGSGPNASQDSRRRSAAASAPRRGEPAAQSPAPVSGPTPTPSSGDARPAAERHQATTTAGGATVPGGPNPAKGLRRSLARKGDAPSAPESNPVPAPDGARAMPPSRAARRVMAEREAATATPQNGTPVPPLSAERPGPAGGPAPTAAQDGRPAPVRPGAGTQDPDAAAPSSDTLPRVPQSAPTRRRSRRDRFASAPDERPADATTPARSDAAGPTAPESSAHELSFPAAAGRGGGSPSSPGAPGPSFPASPYEAGGRPDPAPSYPPVPAQPEANGAFSPMAPAHPEPTEPFPPTYPTEPEATEPFPPAYPTQPEANEPFPPVYPTQPDVNGVFPAAPPAQPEANGAFPPVIPAPPEAVPPAPAYRDDRPALVDGTFTTHAPVPPPPAPAVAPYEPSAPAQDNLWQPPADFPAAPPAPASPFEPAPAAGSFDPSFREDYPSGSFGPVESVPFQPPVIDSSVAPAPDGGFSAFGSSEPGQGHAAGTFGGEPGPGHAAGGFAAEPAGGQVYDWSAQQAFDAADPEPSDFDDQTVLRAPARTFPGAAPEAHIPPVPTDESIRAHTPALFDEEDDPDLEALARSFGAPTRIVWSRPRRNQHYEAVLHPNGVIELADGGQYRHPDTAATAASGSYTADGWSVWRVGEQGPSLTEAFQQRFV